MVQLILLHYSSPFLFFCSQIVYNLYSELDVNARQLDDLKIEKIQRMWFLKMNDMIDRKILKIVVSLEMRMMNFFYINPYSNDVWGLNDEVS